MQQKKAEHPNPAEYLTTVEAAQYLKLSRQFLEVARHRGDGSGPAFIKLQRAVRYRRSALDAWMAAHDHEPDKPLPSGRRRRAAAPAADVPQ